MSNDSNEYLDQVLEEQRIKRDDDDAEALTKRRQEVEDVLRDKYGSKPAIKYGGSHAKGTMIRESYDLDVLCYFANDDDSAGSTLKEIYADAKKTLAKEYDVVGKRSALRVKERGGDDDFHIDVVPGRYVNEDNDDIYLHQSVGDKERLKTNPDVHIAHVKDSGHSDIICLLKFWAHRYNLAVKTFVLELAAIAALDGTGKKTLDARLRHVFTIFRDEIEDLVVEDPANPIGNDLTDLWNQTTRSSLKKTARQTLDAEEDGSWEDVFGPVGGQQNEAAIAAAVSSARTSRTKPARPWLPRR
jgi:hypothetical protein